MCYVCSVLCDSGSSSEFSKTRQAWEYTNIYFHVVVIFFIRSSVSLSSGAYPNIRYSSLRPLFSSLLSLVDDLFVSVIATRVASRSSNWRTCQFPRNFNFKCGTIEMTQRIWSDPNKFEMCRHRNARWKEKRQGKRSLTLFVDEAEAIRPSAPQTRWRNNNDWCHNFPPIKCRLIF